MIKAESLSGSLNYRGVILNAYPDSLGGNLQKAVELLGQKEFSRAFSFFYILPTIFHSDLDRGFSVIDYDLNQELVRQSDLQQLRRQGIRLKLDLVLNHLSVNSPQFLDLLEKSDRSPYRDFFINWNRFWSGYGIPGPDGYIIPDQQYLEKLFMRKPELPVMRISFSDGQDRFYWNTFYQETYRVGGQEHYRGQLDLNAEADIVWRFYRETLEKLKFYGARIVRLDAFAYLHKAPDRKNFFNCPETWQYLDRIRSIAAQLQIDVLPEIHAEYGSGIHRQIAARGYPIYDFFFPGLIIDALENKRRERLQRWINEIINNGYQTINMLGCHDGIPLLDLKGVGGDTGNEPGLLTDYEIEQLINLLVQRGGRVKNLYGPDGKKIAYYQVNATFFSALGEEENKLLLARAIQLFMPGTPQVWYLDLFAGSNDYQAADLQGASSHKEINRSNLSMPHIKEKLNTSLVRKQLAMIQMRNTNPAFYGRLKVGNEPEQHHLTLTWENGPHRVSLHANLRDYSYTINP